MYVNLPKGSYIVMPYMDEYPFKCSNYPRLLISPQSHARAHSHLPTPERSVVFSAHLDVLDAANDVKETQIPFNEDMFYKFITAAALALPTKVLLPPLSAAPPSCFLTLSHTTTKGQIREIPRTGRVYLWHRVVLHRVGRGQGYGGRV